MTGGAVFLDRDGVLNDAEVREGRPHPPASAAEVRPLPGVEAACDRLVAAGWRLVVITNQPDIARGTAEPDEVDAINRAVTGHLPILGVLTCPHDDDDRCECRKPAPGLLLEAAERWSIDLAQSVTVGDRWRDVEAGRAAGTATVFIERGYRERRPVGPDAVVADLVEAAEVILGRWYPTGGGPGA